MSGVDRAALIEAATKAIQQHWGLPYPLEFTERDVSTTLDAVLPLVAQAIATGALWYLDTAGLVWRAEGPERLIADVGPLLERLDQAEKDVNEWKDWEARARGRADDLQQRLDQAEKENERLRKTYDPSIQDADSRTTMTYGNE